MYSLGNAAPVINPGYYDVPIQNKYSNSQRNGPYKKMTNYQFNGQVANQLNNNNENYEIYQSQSFPSPSLFIEQDKSMSGYGYTDNSNQYNGAMIQKKQFNQKQIPQNAPSNILETFDNQQEEVYLDYENTNRLDRNKHNRNQTQGLQQHHQPNITYNNNFENNQSPDYLNVGSMPNIAGLYNQHPVQQHHQPPMQHHQRPMQHHRPPVQNVIVQNDALVKEVDDDEKTIYYSDDDDDDKSTSIKNLKKKKKKVKQKKSKSDKMMYLVILLLAVIIGLMLYIILGNKKKVRF